MVGRERETRFVGAKCHRFSFGSTFREREGGGANRDDFQTKLWLPSFVYFESATLGSHDPQRNLLQTCTWCQMSNDHLIWLVYKCWQSTEGSSSSLSTLKMKQLLSFLGAGLKLSGDKTKFIGAASQTLSHCFLPTKLLVHWIILLATYIAPHILREGSPKFGKRFVGHFFQISFSVLVHFWFRKGIDWNKHFEKMLSKAGPVHIIQLSRGKVLPERKTFDINLCHCQHLHYVTVLVKVKNNPDKKVQMKGLN